jgi:hypothetical protein
MKKILLILTLIFSFSPVSYGKVSPQLITNFEKSAVYKKLKTAVPAGWAITNKRQQLIIERKEPVWILTENKINAPLKSETNNEKISRIKKYGHLSKSKLIFRVENNWPPAKIIKEKQKNQSIRNEISGLLKKYNIAHLLNKNLSVKGREYFNQASPEEEKRIQDYQKKKAELEKKIISLPDYQLGKYSLFLISQNGQEDEFHTIYPERAQLEIFFIKNKLKEISDK